MLKPAYNIAGLAAKVRPAIQFTAAVGEIAGEKHVYLLAAGIAFNTLLCALPLMLVATSVVGMMWDERSASAAIRQMLTDFLPPSASSAEVITSALAEVRVVFEFSSAAGYIGAATLIWTASALVSSIRNALNVVFSLPSPRFFILYKLKDLGLTLSFSLLLLVVSALAPAVTLVSSFGSAFLPAELAAWFGGTAANLTAALGTLIFMYFLYGYLPNTKLSARLRFRAAFICAGFLEIARYLFGWYLATAASFGKIYGVYAVLTAVALWVYYASLIIIMSGVIALAAERRGGFREILLGKA